MLRCISRYLLLKATISSSRVGPGEPALMPTASPDSATARNATRASFMTHLFRPEPPTAMYQNCWRSGLLGLGRPWRIVAARVSSNVVLRPSDAPVVPGAVPRGAAQNGRDIGEP